MEDSLHEPSGAESPWKERLTGISTCGTLSSSSGCRLPTRRIRIGGTCHSSTQASSASVAGLTGRFNYSDQLFPDEFKVLLVRASRQLMTEAKEHTRPSRSLSEPASSMNPAALACSPRGSQALRKFCGTCLVTPIGGDSAFRNRLTLACSRRRQVNGDPPRLKPSVRHHNHTCHADASIAAAPRERLVHVRGWAGVSRSSDYMAMRWLHYCEPLTCILPCSSRCSMSSRSH